MQLDIKKIKKEVDLNLEKKETKVKELDKLPPTIFDLAESYLNNNYKIRKNIVLDTFEIKSANGNDAFKILEDESNLYIELQKNRVNISMEKLRALLKSDFLEQYNPILEYFEKLPTWDSRKDIIDDVANYIKISKGQRNRFNIQFKKMMVRCVACALSPKVFNKQIFVIVQSKQDTGKTSFIRWLSPDQLSDYYTENINFDDKDSHISITENFIINIDELATLHRTEINKLKSFISKQDDKSRRAYAVRAVRRVRIASFLASTNDMEFLTDTTGNVRWLCFQIEGIDFNYSKDFSIDELWSQAYTLYKEGFKYQLTGNEVIENELVNSNFMKQPPEAEIINRHFIPGTKDNHDYFLTSTDLANLIGTLFQIKNVSVVRAGQSMNYLGFERKTHYKKNLKKSHSIYGYYVLLDRDENFSETIDLHLNSRFVKNSIK